ncbi:hypothetical protein GCM10027456_11800 [Kineosporia babensis]
MAGSLAGRRVVAVDGRGASGKTSLARRLAEHTGATVVHSDDVAWNHSRFDWDEQMISGVLTPYLAGTGVHYQPPGWASHGRDGHITVAADAALLIIEGVGVSRRSLVPYLDVAIWVRSDYADAKRRGLERDMAEQGTDHATAERLWDEWEAEEVPFLQDDRPWERADVIVGAVPETPELRYDPSTEVLIGAGPGSYTPPGPTPS